MKIRIFCDDNFFRSTTERKIPDDNITEIIKFFVSIPDSFVFPFTKEEYDAFVGMPQYNKLKFLTKKWTDSRIKMDFNSTVDVENNIDKADEVTLYFGSYSLCQKAEQYGEMCVNLDKVEDFTELRIPSPFSVTQGNYFNWEECFNNMPSKICNSMVFVDNYILSENGLANLESILDSLLPESLPIEFHLTIVALESTSFKSDDYKYKIEKELGEWLANSRPNIDFKKLEVLLIKKNENHDRYILTNNYAIYCQGGFDLINKKGQSTKTTSGDIEYPFIRIRQNQFDKYTTYIGNIKKCFRKRGIGSKNRLLSITA